MSRSPATTFLSGDADLLINVVDASNLERNLYLTLQLLELGIPCIVALNMLDIATSQRIRIDIDVAALSARLGCPVVPLVSTRADGIDALKQAIDRHAGYREQLALGCTTRRSCVKEVGHVLSDAMPQTLPAVQRRWLALQMLEGDIYSHRLAGPAVALLPAATQALQQQQQEDPALVIADARYQSIAALCDAVSNSQQAMPNRLTEMLDKVILNRWLGVPIFLLVMYLMFLLAINIGGALQPIFDNGSAAIFIHGIQWLGYTLHFPDWLTVFLAQGIGGGINTVLPLVPQIGMMYLFLSFLEDSGYMARAAFVMDRLMQALGLPGKSFVPLIVGFGCNVPSIMGARTLDAPRERLMTIMMAPFMSCGARLAIFAVFAAAFFGQDGALVVFSLYLLGIVVAILTGLMLKHTIMRGEASPFVMELPVYHVPHLKSLLLQTWQRLKGFVLRAGKVIVLVSLFIGGLNSFTLSGKTVDNINDSALASVSKVLTPLLQPMGVHRDNWQATVGLVTGAMAKEVVVGTLNTLYTAEHIQEEAFDAANFNLLDELGGALNETWDGLKDTFSLSVLANPIEASKGDGEMGDGSMGVMGEQIRLRYRGLQLPDLRAALRALRLRDGRDRPRIEPRLDGLLDAVGAERRLLAGDALLPGRHLQPTPTVQPDGDPGGAGGEPAGAVRPAPGAQPRYGAPGQRYAGGLLPGRQGELSLMAGLLQVRDALALLGSAQAQQLSQSLATPLPLVQAMLDRLAAMGKVERIEQDDGACLSGSCKGCPQGQGCSTVFYRLKA